MTTKFLPAIVVPAFTRAGSLSRLLHSIESGCFADGDRPKVIVSLEFGATADVARVAREFKERATHLSVDVVQQTEKLGLRKHILWCGGLSEEHGAVIVLEDDLMVDRYFYRYAQAALEFYESDSLVGSIALYAYEHNEFASLPFSPLGNGYSAYPMQVACSWGQCWSATQWKRFRNWYDTATPEIIQATVEIPARVRQWSPHSWKKYFATFLAKTGSCVMYPYQGYSTNCADPGGQHNVVGSSVHQVHFGWQGRRQPNWEFCHRTESAVSYDAFMEQCGVGALRELGIDEADTSLDIYATKPLELLQQKRWSITRRRVAHPVKTFALRFRPVEQNLQFPLQDQSNGDIAMAESKNVTASRRRFSYSTLSYFAGFNLDSKHNFSGLVRHLPSVLMQKILKKLQRVFGR